MFSVSRDEGGFKVPKCRKMIMRAVMMCGLETVVQRKRDEYYEDREGRSRLDVLKVKPERPDSLVQRDRDSDHINKRMLKMEEEQRGDLWI